VLSIPSVPFTDITDWRGSLSSTKTGRTATNCCPRRWAAAARFFDYDGDGHPDLLLVNSQRWPWDQRPDRAGHVGLVPQRRDGTLYRRHRRPPGWTSLCTAWEWPWGISTMTGTSTCSSARWARTGCSATRGDGTFRRCDAFEAGVGGGETTGAPVAAGSTTTTTACWTCSSAPT
jgi:hypothetical protein